MIIVYSSELPSLWGQKRKLKFHLLHPWSVARVPAARWGRQRRWWRPSAFRCLGNSWCKTSRCTFPLSNRSREDAWKRKYGNVWTKRRKLDRPTERILGGSLRDNLLKIYSRVCILIWNKSLSVVHDESPVMSGDSWYFKLVFSLQKSMDKTSL